MPPATIKTKVPRIWLRSELVRREYRQEAFRRSHRGFRRPDKFVSTEGKGERSISRPYATVLAVVLGTFGGPIPAVAGDAAVFVKSCGNARPDLEVCLLWNRKARRGTLDFVFHGDRHDTLDVAREKSDRAGVDWYVGYGKVQDARLYLWLRVDDSGALLPVMPRPPRTAAVFYRTSVNQRWQPYPSSTQFLFADVGN